MTRRIALALLLLAGCSESSSRPLDGGGGSGGEPDLSMPSGPDGGGDHQDGGSTVTMCPAANRPPLASGTCQVTAGTSGATLITGTVLAPGNILRGGQVLISNAGLLVCVDCDCSAQAAGATQVDCPTGVISPGLINTHDHITFQSKPEKDSGERYEQRHDWRLGLRGHTKISSGGSATNEQVKFAELRFLIGGATSTVGSGGTAGLLRNLDKADPLQEGLGAQPVVFDTFPLGDSKGTQITDSCAYPSIEQESAIEGDSAYFPHISEGIDAVARNEFLCTSSTSHGGQDLAQPQSAFIHSIGLEPADYALMAGVGTALVWSPRSNTRLYGDTARVVEATRLGVQVTLGTDWLPSGSMNLLRELHCADGLNRDYFAGFFSDEQLWQMTTTSAALATAVDGRLGSLKAGLHGDVSIFDGASRVDFRAIIDAEPHDVVLVMRDGKPLYGDAAVVAGLRDQTMCEALDVCGGSKLVCVADEISETYAKLTMAQPAGFYPLFFCGTPDNEPSCTPSRPASVAGSTIYTGARTTTDQDGDGIPDADDLCPTVFDPIRPVDQGKPADADGDGVGDACDPCPLMPGTSGCKSVDPNDLDGDGFPNASDDCPNDYDPNQTDSDGDGKGDVCDACPHDANPGAQACPATIYQIKSGAIAVGQTVSVAGPIVTGRSAQGYFAQVKETDAGWTGSANSGIFVYEPTNTVKVGDRVTIESGLIENFHGQIELANTTTHVDMSNGEAPPAPVTVSAPGVPLTAAVLASGTVAAALESVIVQLQNPVVTDTNPPLGAGDVAPSNEFVVDGALRVNDYLYLITPAPALGDSFGSLSGVLEFRDSNFKIEPRGANDVTLGPPRLVSVSPDAFVRLNGTAAIPNPIQVVLSHAVTADTPVAIVSSQPSALVVPASVTVMAGHQAADVPVNGMALTTGAAQITASLNGVNASGNCTVIDVDAPATLVDFAPAAATVSTGVSITMTVTLDVPAPSAGAQVGITATAGIFPSTVTVMPDQLQATFTYQQAGSNPTDTVTATLDAASFTSTISLQPSHLVINEVDYDQPSTDTTEFVEIYNAGGAPASLTNLAVVLVNGSGSVEYSRTALSGTLAAGGYLVIAAPATVVDPTATVIRFPVASNNIQNGNPDGIALFDTAAGKVVDALSYGGPITAAKINGFPGQTFNLVEGAAATAKDSSTATGSLSRLPNGSDTDNAAVDWVLSKTPTPGAANQP